jgi:hypothetical protein
VASLGLVAFDWGWWWGCFDCWGWHCFDWGCWWYCFNWGWYCFNWGWHCFNCWAGSIATSSQDVGTELPSFFHIVTCNNGYESQT